MRTRTELGQALDQARRTTDALFQLIRPDALCDRPIPERHRLVFYLGHLEAFDWNLIARHALDVSAFHPTFDRLFAFGIDPPPGQLPDDTPASWPGLDEIARYNSRTREIVDDLVDRVPEQLLHVAIEHRLMHAETFAYLLHQLPYEKKVGSTPPPDMVCPPPRHEFIEIPAGDAVLGLERDRAFGWDNEFEEHTVSVPAFTMGRYKVTNRDYLKFVAEGGSVPFFWSRHGEKWMYRGMFDEYPLPLDNPVYVTQEQASAYAAHCGMRLPTEAEFHRVAVRATPSSNVDFREWDPIPVTADDNGSDAPSQLIGNGWEWTSTPFEPFPGFEPFPFYANYSEPFFDGNHFVLKGGSPRTAACFLRPSFRNWFRPAYPYVYGTFRMVQS